MLQASLMSSLQIVLDDEGEWRFPPDKPPYRLIHNVFARGPRENIPAAYAKVAAAMVPATRDQVEEWLAMLQVATAGGRRSEGSSKLALAVYVNALKDYPADVVKAAAERAMAEEEWFPPLARLINACKHLSANRKLMLETFARSV